MSIVIARCDCHLYAWSTYDCDAAHVLFLPWNCTPPTKPQWLSGSNVNRISENAPLISHHFTWCCVTDFFLSSQLYQISLIKIRTSTALLRVTLRITIRLILFTTFLLSLSAIIVIEISLRFQNIFRTQLLGSISTSPGFNASSSVKFNWIFCTAQLLWFLACLAFFMLYNGAGVDNNIFLFFSRALSSILLIFSLLILLGYVLLHESEECALVQ